MLFEELEDLALSQLEQMAQKQALSRQKAEDRPIADDARL
jgi:hypothetical protein